MSTAPENPENAPTVQIRTLLVANRGEIACRIIRTARTMGIKTVAVHSDIDKHAPHVREADVHIALGGASATESYLDQDKILAAARNSGADAIHPGYGFLSENAEFAEACGRRGLIFIGPQPDDIRSMGRKDHAKDIAVAAGVPVLPDARLDDDDTSAWLEAAKKIGYPLLVKAVAGGGGKGMRIVHGEPDLLDEITGAKREAQSAFGDGAVFLEKYLSAPRHVEIQVFGDAHGNAIHLMERECSIQRRHQKIIEEAPSSAVDSDLREQMGSTAVSLVRKLGYIGAGTVEFLLDDTMSPPRFYFLEMNTRLQVEHPVTESITGLDLVRMQIDVASNRPLVVSQADIRADGHAIEVRLYAEDPGSDFLPTPGVLHSYRHGTLEGIRFDDGIGHRAEISAFYDPMIAKVTAHATTRQEAALRLAAGLGELHLHGTTTNRDYLVAILRNEDFLAGDTRTDFVENHPELLEPPRSTELVRRHLAAAIAVSVARRRTASAVKSAIAPGWRLLPGHRAGRAQWQDVTTGNVYDVGYQQSAATNSARLTLDIERVEHHFLLDELTDTAVRIVDTETSVGTWVSVSDPYPEIFVNDRDSQSAWVMRPRLPEQDSNTAASDPVAELPGTVVAINVKPGDDVVAGQKLVVMEAMKMEHPALAHHDGTVSAVHVEVGQYIEAHTVLVTLTKDEA